MLRHHSFAKSLVQEKERDLKEEGRTDAYNYHILQSDTHTCLIRKMYMYPKSPQIANLWRFSVAIFSKALCWRKNRWNFRENGIDH